jgi:Dyp-type peroxidase family
MSATVDFADVQGLLRYGYSGLTDACFLLLRIKDRVAAQAWLRTAPVTSAVECSPPPQTALQVAFTRSGLEALAVPLNVVQQFAPEFISGLAGEESRSRRLGDAGANAPAQWLWGTAAKTPDLMVMLYAAPGGLEGWKQKITGEFWEQAFDVIVSLPSAAMSGFEPFGFKDGISQPDIDWEETKKLPGDLPEYSNLTALGEFLLGYRNEYGKYSVRPLLPSGEDASAGLLPAEEDPDKRDLARNGSYLVLRQLEQDVGGFWRFLEKHAGGDSAASIRLAEAMVGRRMSGEPLIEPAGEDLNQFTYEKDSEGARCPFGAHIRRANPRNGDFPYGTRGLWQRLLRMAGLHRTSFRDDLVSSTRFHRILRRGRAYAAAETQHKGIYFIGLNANISRQFEFVQNAWVMSSKFDGLSEESDPLLGNRLPIAGCPATDMFSLPQEHGPRRRISGMPQFITVRGGAYFFLPSIRALWYIATIG